MMRIPIACGNVVRPDSSAVRPRRFCRYSGITKIRPTKLAIANALVMLALRNMRSTNSRSCSIGCGTRSSTNVIATNATAPTVPVRTTVGDVQPSVGPSLRA